MAGTSQLLAVSRDVWVLPDEDLLYVCRNAVCLLSLLVPRLSRQKTTEFRETPAGPISVPGELRMGPCPELECFQDVAVLHSCLVVLAGPLLTIRPTHGPVCLWEEEVTPELPNLHARLQPPSGLKREDVPGDYPVG